jgi:very-short-patch-repair endonuclease
MFDENQLIEVKWHNKTKKHYESKGYIFTNYNDTFWVKAKDLPKGSGTKIEVICDFCKEKYYPSYNAFNIRVNKSIDTCSKCRAYKQWMATKDKRAKKKFNMLRQICKDNDYQLITDESEFVGSNTPIEYICKKHGVQTQSLDNLIHGHKCIHCSYEERGLNCRNSIEYVKSIIESCNNNILLNPNEYIGSNVHNLKIKCGLCGKTYETSFSDYTTNKQIRCASCSQSESIGEMIIRQFLEKNNIDYIQEKRFDDCRDNRPLPFDFYLPQYNLIVEFDGKQHFEDTGFGNHEITKKHDAIKNQYCQSHNIDLLRIPYWQGNYIEDIIADKLNL